MNKLHKKSPLVKSLTLRNMIDNELIFNELSDNYKKTEPKTSQNLLEMEKNDSLSSKKKCTQV